MKKTYKMSVVLGNGQLFSIVTTFGSTKNEKGEFYFQRFHGAMWNPDFVCLLVQKAIGWGTTRGTGFTSFYLNYDKPSDTISLIFNLDGGAKLFMNLWAPQKDVRCKGLWYLTPTMWEACFKSHGIPLDLARSQKKSAGAAPDEDYIDVPGWMGEQHGAENPIPGEEVPF